MVKIITTTNYICSICDKGYHEFADAEECEKRGRSKKYPVGLIFGDASEGFYKGITFAIAKNQIDGHGNYPALWACRDISNKAGDSLGKDVCGGGHHLELGESDKPDITHPTFKRMVKWLRSKKMKLIVWNGKEIISLKKLQVFYKKPSPKSNGG